MTWLISAAQAYAITQGETIDVIIPATVLTGGVALTATSTLHIDALPTGGGGGLGSRKRRRSELERLRKQAEDDIKAEYDRILAPVVADALVEAATKLAEASDEDAEEDEMLLLAAAKVFH